MTTVPSRTSLNMVRLRLFAGIIWSPSISKPNHAFRNPNHPRSNLMVQLLVANLLHLLFLPRNPPTQPPYSITPDHQTRRNRRLAIHQHTLSAHLRHLTPPYSPHILLSLHARRQRVEHHLLAAINQLARWLPHSREARVEVGERRVTKGIGARDVGPDVGVGSGEVRRDGRRETRVGAVG